MHSKDTDDDVEMEDAINKEMVDKLNKIVDDQNAEQADPLKLSDRPVAQETPAPTTESLMNVIDDENTSLQHLAAMQKAAKDEEARVNEQLRKE